MRHRFAGLTRALELTRQSRLPEALATIQRELGLTARTSTPRSAAPQQAKPDRPVPHAKTPLRTAGPAAAPNLFEGLAARLPGGMPTRRAPVPVVVPPGARFESLSHAGAAGQRNYRLYVPSFYRAETPMPLVVMLHGCKQSPEDFAVGTGMNALAEAQTFLVAWPAQSEAANSVRCWNWFNASDQERDSGEPALIAGITRDIIATYAVDPARVYVAGLSAGGAAAAIMGARYPDLYAAIGVHSGLACGAARDVPSAFAAMSKGGRRGPGAGSGVPAIVFHGDRDTTVVPLNGQQVIAQAGGGEARVKATTVQAGRSDGGQSFTRTIYSNADGKAQAEYWLLHDAGHAWSGGNASGSFTDPDGPDASAEMMRFFGQHRLG